MFSCCGVVVCSCVVSVVGFVGVCWVLVVGLFV